MDSPDVARWSIMLAPRILVRYFIPPSLKRRLSLKSDRLPPIESVSLNLTYKFGNVPLPLPVRWSSFCCMRSYTTLSSDSSFAEKFNSTDGRIFVLTKFAA